MERLGKSNPLLIGERLQARLIAHSDADRGKWIKLGLGLANCYAHHGCGSPDVGKCRLVGGVVVHVVSLRIFKT